MRILISGASGFIGKPLSFFLSSQGHRIVRLIRDFGKQEPDSVSWNPEEGKARKEDFEGFDAVIHLAGEPLTLSRWSEKKRKKILLSRTVGTTFLSHLFSTALRPPKLFLSASAFGFYGDRGEKLLTEESEAGRGFLAHVCCAWEKASYAMKKRGARVVQARFGIVLGPDGGVLKKMVPPYRLGLGGRLGSGKQWISWIALEDLMRAVDHVMSREFLEGAVNIVSPHPIRQEEFSKILAECLHRPHWLSIPAPLLRFFFGQTADELLLSSAKVEPTKLLASNFVFQYPDLRSALFKALRII